MHKLAVSMWVMGVVTYAATGMPSSGPAEQAIPIAPSPISSTGGQPKTPVGGTLAEIVERRAPHITGPVPELLNDDPAEKVVVSRPVVAHSEPIISAPTTYRFPQGKELQVLSWQNGWIKVVDPVTKFRGWVLQIYVAPPNATIAKNNQVVKEQGSATAPPAELADATLQRKRMKSKRAELRQTRRGGSVVDASVSQPRYVSGNYRKSNKRRHRSQGQEPEARYSDRRFLLRPFALRQYRSVY